MVRPAKGLSTSPTEHFWSSLLASCPILFKLSSRSIKYRLILPALRLTVRLLSTMPHGRFIFGISPSLAEMDQEAQFGGHKSFSRRGEHKAHPFNIMKNSVISTQQILPLRIPFQSSHSAVSTTTLKVDIQKIETVTETGGQQKQE